MEIDVLIGAKKTIKRCRPVIFAECNSLEASAPILKWAQVENYLAYGVLSPAYNQGNFAGNIENSFGKSKETGMMLIPAEACARYENEVHKQHLPQLLTADDLALLLLHKPQYPYEVLGHTVAVASLSLAYTSPQADMLNQALAERDGQITSLEQAVSEYEGRIAAYHNAILGRDEQISSLNQAVAERDRVIHETYRSHSWQMTKPIRFFSRMIRKSINFGLKLKPSKIQFIYRLAKPHFHMALRKQGTFKSKLHFFILAWRSGGHRGVIQRLQQSDAIQRPAESPYRGISAMEFMQQLAVAPNNPEPAELISNKKVAVIIPVYRGAAETKRCIESVIHSNNLTPHEIIIINDCSPESEVDALLASYEGKYSHVQILKNDTNLGFVLTVNRGMRLAGEADVILLNSDTEVANNWLDRLIRQAYADDTIGTVTPFSNNATICNYPDIYGWSLLPVGETVSSLDKACSSANAGRAIDIPTAVGFCMYIKHSCLADVGLFDENAFGKGYGEENDFSLRAASKGWRHILATDIFVFHEGEISFSESASAKKTHAMKVIRGRYPNYENTIFSHVRQNSAYPYRVAATAARYRLDERPVVLFITHTFGGGTEKHVQELADAISSNNARVLFLRPFNGANGSDVILEAHNKSDRLSVGLSSQNIELLAKVLNAYGISKVHVHHTIGFKFTVEELISFIGAPYDVTVHDFYAICPRINLMVPNKGYCGSPTVDDCNACLTLEPKPGGEPEIIWWRAKFGSLLNGANHVYCPSKDTASRILQHFPVAPARVVPHESVQLPPPRIVSAARTTRRFAILGVLAEHKGLSLIEEALAEINHRKLPMEFALIGYPERPLTRNKHFMQTGPYKDEELPALIEKTDPDAILFSARWPETYSYTLTAALLSGRPIVVSDLGALPERIAEVSNGHVYPHDVSGSQLVDLLMSLSLEAHAKGIEEAAS